MKPLPPALWHERFQQQATWTESARRYLLSQILLTAESRLLEAGSGTGAVTSWLASATPAEVYGLDISYPFLGEARDNDERPRYVTGDALRMPFSAGVFDAVVCHFFLLWVPQAPALAEMTRVTRAGGWVIAFAEPDYGGRIDYPPPLESLGQLQAASLRAQGADPNTGRKLSALFHDAGLRQVATGVLGGQWQGAPPQAAIEDEWRILVADLEGMVEPRQLEELRRVNESAWREGRRVLFVPTFYAVGRK